MLDDFLKEVERLKKAEELLQKIWISLPAYVHRDVLPRDVSNALEEFFSFDDSE